MRFTHFVLLDDDPVSTLINEFALDACAVKGENKITFDDPVACLEYVASGLLPIGSNACLLLDLNMPKLNGWQFLREFARLPHNVRSQYTVVIVRSSFDPKDQEQAEAHPFVSGFVNKPLTAPTLGNQLDRLDQRKRRA